MITATEKKYLKQRWFQLLGENGTELTEEERKSRWEKWKRLAIKDGNAGLVEFWSDASMCKGCIHLNQSEAWCTLQGLPCTVNPILTYQLGHIGMACCGAAYSDGIPKQIDIEQYIEHEKLIKSGDLPF